MVLKPHCRYSLCTCLIPSSVLFSLRFLIILTMGNRMCWDIEFRKPMPFMCKRSQHRWISCIFNDLIGDAWYHNRLHMPNLVPDHFAFKMWHTASIDMLIHPNIFSKNWGFCRILSSTACRIYFIGCPVMCYNLLTWDALLTSWEVYIFFFSSTFGMGVRESFTML